jgi:hypothetical protein
MWLVKMAYGLLKEQKMRLEENKIKEKFSEKELSYYKNMYKGGDIANLCKEKEIIAIGWTLPTRR